jgi:hypothetical protein
MGSLPHARKKDEHRERPIPASAQAGSTQPARRRRTAAAAALALMVGGLYLPQIVNAPPAGSTP